MTTRFSSGPGFITLLDGPGEGQKFTVKRAPIFVRVVSTNENKWDILDQLEDEPERLEEVHVYRQLDWMHARANDRKHSGVYYNYVHVPIDGTLKAVFRSTRRWQEWAAVAATQLEHEDQ